MRVRVCVCVCVQACICMGVVEKRDEDALPSMRLPSSLPLFPRCKSITPVRILKELVLVLYGNHRLTHLNLSSNNLGIPVSTMIFKTLRHSACNIQYLW